MQLIFCEWSKGCSWYLSLPFFFTYIIFHHAQLTSQLVRILWWCDKSFLKGLSPLWFCIYWITIFLSASTTYHRNTKECPVKHLGSIHSFSCLHWIPETLFPLGIWSQSRCSVSSRARGACWQSQLKSRRPTLYPILKVFLH